MRALLPLCSLAALTVAVGFAAACSSSDSGAASGEQGPLSGTYSADSLAGTSPFVAITFTDSSHYAYVARSCIVEDATATGTGYLEADPRDPVADDGASSDPSPDLTDDGCVHSGTYTLSATQLTLTDDGASTRISVPIAQLDANGTEAARSLKVATLVVGGPSLVDANAGSIGQFSANGTNLRRTGLNSDGASGSLLTDQAVALAEKWVDVKMPYCQAANGAPEPDKDCVKLHGKTCNRTGAADSVAWNAYRSDCSGLVSFSWSLPAPGLTTPDFVPGAAKYIPMKDLAPGDALLRRKHHIVLFKEWKDKDAGEATVIAEPGCAVKNGPYAQEESWSFGKAPGAKTSANVKGCVYYAIRKK